MTACCPLAPLPVMMPRGCWRSPGVLCGVRKGWLEGEEQGTGCCRFECAVVTLWQQDAEPMLELFETLFGPEDAKPLFHSPHINPLSFPCCASQGSFSGCREAKAKGRIPAHFVSVSISCCTWKNVVYLEHHSTSSLSQPCGTCTENQQERPEKRT